MPETSIRLESETRDDLRALKVGGESYTETIDRLIAMQEQNEAIADELITLHLEVEDEEISDHLLELASKLEDDPRE